MQRRSINNVIKSLVLICVGLPMLSSAEASAKPARFGDALSELTATVTLPAEFEGGHKTLAVYCQTDVSISGDLDNIQCYQHPKIANLEQQTVSALEKSTFEPAEIDGKTVPVRMQFRVVYSRSGDQPDIVLLPNLGTLQNQHGVSYFAPQERLDRAERAMLTQLFSGGDSIEMDDANSEFPQAVLADLAAMSGARKAA